MDGAGDENGESSQRYPRQGTVQLCEGYPDRRREAEANYPKMGKVNEMCREWLVREDGALAYQLQSQEINQHYLGNKYRNAQVREDFPCALDEQLREQQLAEQAAAVYQKMLQEQEEIDKQVAKQLAEKIEREERMKRRAIEMRDEDIARQMLEKEREKTAKMKQSVNSSPHKPTSLPLRSQENSQSPHRPDSNNYFANLPRRRAPQMPLPSDDYNDLYVEPYRPPEKLTEDFDRIDIQEVGLPIDEVVERKLQEERDAELARQLQEQLSNSEESIMNRDRLLAIEAQDKELAKMLQERERAKAKRAKERAKQKALAKKQQLLEQEQQQHQIMPDDSYSNPIDLLPTRSIVHDISAQSYPLSDEETNYSFPVDVLANRVHEKYGRGYEERLNGGPSGTMPSYVNEQMPDLGDVPPPQRPTQLDLRSPLTQKLGKPRFPDPIDEPTPEDPFQQLQQQQQQQQQMPSPSKQHVNIAMAIDPTYPRRSGNMVQSPPSYDTTSSTVTTSTSSSSPGMMLPTPDILEDDDPSPVPPYMPMKGQRRTSSLEKKTKKKGKDGCKQQ